MIHSLLDAKITNVLSLCHDKTILAAVQSIIENMISCEDTSQQQLHFLQVHYNPLFSTFKALISRAVALEGCGDLLGSSPSLIVMLRMLSCLSTVLRLW